MKKLAIAFFVTIFSTFGFSQVEEYASRAINAFERESSTVNNFYLQGKLMKAIKEGKYEEFLEACDRKGFKIFSKTVYVNGTWEGFYIMEDQSNFVSIFDEIRRGLPKKINTSPTKTTTESRIDDRVIDYWAYTNTDGKKCEIKVFFVNDQFRAIGYWIYE